MKTTKFRAWHNGQMYDVNTLGLNLKGINPGMSFAHKVHQSSLKMDKDCEMFDEKTIFIQYTGLKDKNGKEIYSDDILFDKNIDIKFRVYSTYGGFVIKAPYWATQNMNNLILGDDLITESLSDAQVGSWIKQSCEVIGNIYENPELLKYKL